MPGNNAKLASNGPVAAPAVLNSVVIPVLFIRSSTLACTHATIAGNKIPDKKAAGSIKAAQSNAICGQEARLKGPDGAFTASPGKSRYAIGTTIAADNKRIARK